MKPVFFKSSRFWKAWAITAVLYAVLFPTALFLMMPGHSWFDYLVLTLEAEQTKGTITSVQPAVHCQFQFSYSVKGKSYSNIGTDCSAKQGTEVSVFFLPENPAISADHYPEDIVIGNFVAILMGLLTFPIFVGYSWYRRKRNIFGITIPD